MDTIIINIDYLFFCHLYDILLIYTIYVFNFSISKNNFLKCNLEGFNSSRIFILELKEILMKEYLF